MTLAQADRPPPTPVSLPFALSLSLTISPLLRAVAVSGALAERCAGGRGAKRASHSFFVTKKVCCLPVRWCCRLCVGETLQDCLSQFFRYENRSCRSLPAVVDRRLARICCDFCPPRLVLDIPRRLLRPDSCVFV